MEERKQEKREERIRAETFEGDEVAERGREKEVSLMFSVLMPPFERMVHSSDGGSTTMSR